MVNGLPGNLARSVAEYLIADGRFELVQDAPELQVVDGYLPIPKAPGLGVELDEQVISKYDCVRIK